MATRQELRDSPAPEQSSESPTAQHPEGTARSGLELAVVIPTFNEAQNVRPLVEALEAIHNDTRFEIVFVDDDSPDQTWKEVADLARGNSKVRIVRRLGRRGLAGAVIEGALATTAPYVVVMDADFQHDEALQPEMLRLLKNDECDLVVASRYIADGSAKGLNSRRSFYSRAATRLAQLVLRVPLSDPMSGFFGFNRRILESAGKNIGPAGFKILLDLFVSSTPTPRFLELPYTFRERRAGDSKLDLAASWDFLVMLIAKLTRGLVPASMISFALVGGLAALVHLAILWLLHPVLSLGFSMAQGASVLSAATSNYALNNALTFKDQRRHGRGFLLGLFAFYLVAAIGAAGNWWFAVLVYDQGLPWWFAGLCGVIVGGGWNYFASKWMIWRGR